LFESFAQDEIKWSTSMANSSGSKKKAMTNPSARFSRPDDVLAAHELSRQEKKSALETWEQDSRQFMTASNEGMPGKAEGLRKDDHHRLGQVQRAKATIRTRSAKKPRG
jgi:hypothetical protein